MFNYNLFITNSYLSVFLFIYEFETISYDLDVPKQIG